MYVNCYPHKQLLINNLDKCALYTAKLVDEIKRGSKYLNKQEDKDKIDAVLVPVNKTCEIIGRKCDTELQKVVGACVQPILANLRPFETLSHVLGKSEHDNFSVNDRFVIKALDQIQDTLSIYTNVLEKNLYDKFIAMMAKITSGYIFDVLTSGKLRCNYVVLFCKC